MTDNDRHDGIDEELRHVTKTMRAVQAFLDLQDDVDAKMRTIAATRATLAMHEAALPGMMAGLRKAAERYIELTGHHFDVDALIMKHFEKL